MSVREPPNSAEAEECLLACLLMDGRKLIAQCVAEPLPVSAFYFAANQAIYSKILEIHRRGDEANVAVVRLELEASKQLEAIGGDRYIAHVSDRVPTTALERVYFEKVRELHDRREILRSVREIDEKVEDPQTTPEDLVDVIKRQIDRLAKVGSTGKAWPNPIPARELCARPPETPSVLVEGLLYRGGTMLLSGPSKAHKTFAMLAAGIAISEGRRWLGFDTVATPVLYLNLELQDFATAARIERICQVTGTKPPTDFHPWNLRGRRVTLAELQDRLPREIKRLGAGVVMIDPHYRVSAVSGGEENSNDSQGLLLSALETVCVSNGAALVLSHHFAKGDAGAKNAIDRASGGGVFARWGDVMMTFTPHEEEEAMSVEMALRNFAPVAPFVVRWEHPVWIRDGQLDPAKLRKAGGRAETNTPDKALASLTGLMGFGEWRTATGMSETTFRRKLRALVDAEKVEQVGQLYRKAAA